MSLQATEHLLNQHNKEQIEKTLGCPNHSISKFNIASSPSTGLTSQTSRFALSGNRFFNFASFPLSSAMLDIANRSTSSVIRFDRIKLLIKDGDWATFVASVMHCANISRPSALPEKKSAAW